MKQFLNFSLTIFVLLLCTSNSFAQSGIKNLIKSIEKNEYAVIVELGAHNSNVYQSSDLFQPEIKLRDKKQFKRDDNNWDTGHGFTAGIKLAKQLSSNLLDSKISLDVITGLIYQETNMIQKNYNPHSFNTMPGIIDCFGILYYRELQVKSISMPLEFRSNFKIYNFTISPTIGLGVNIPTNKSYNLYYPSYESNTNTKGEFIESDKLSLEEKFMINSISKIELSYSFHYNHKLKLAGFYNLNIKNELSSQLRSGQGFSASGIQLGYEIPLSALLKAEGRAL